MNLKHTCARFVCWLPGTNRKPSNMQHSLRSGTFAAAAQYKLSLLSIGTVCVGCVYVCFRVCCDCEIVCVVRVAHDVRALWFVCYGACIMLGVSLCQLLLP